MAKISYWLVMVFVMSVALQEGGEANSIDCDGPVRKQASAMCVAFVRSGKLQEPPAACCRDYRKFVELLSKTRAERRQLCSCIQRLAALDSLEGPVNIKNLDDLQEKCGLPFIYSADPNFDCNTVN